MINEEIVMKAIKLLFVSFFLLFASTAQADGEYIGPAFRVDEGGNCFWYTADWRYEGTSIVQYSNGKKGHATFKCKMTLIDGDGAIYYQEGDTGSFPLGSTENPDAMCYTTLEADVNTAMWTSQCFNAWESGE